MMTASAEPRRWPLPRWVLAVGVVSLLQALLVLWLSDHAPSAPRATAPAQILRLTAEDAEAWLALQNPVLFGLPPQQSGFSGVAWLKFQPLHYEPADAPEPLRWLELPAQTLAGEFRNFMATNLIPQFPTLAPPTPILTFPALAAPEPLSPPSFLRREGGLAKRALLEEIPLPAQTNWDLVAPSRVQMLVDATGAVLSAVTLPAGNSAQLGLRSPEADQMALILARRARFAPASGLTLGDMVFEWQTVAPPDTNAPPVAP